MRIRPTLARDIPRLAAIERSAAQAFKSLPALAWLADDEVLDEPMHTACMEAGGSWVAVDGQDEVVGFLCARKEGQALHIHEVSVHQDAQGQGVGRALLLHAVGAARGMGCAELTLTTFEQVPWNAPFYARLGFEPLSAAQVDERLRGLLANEQRHGLTGRCAMRMSVPG